MYDELTTSQAEGLSILRTTSDNVFLTGSGGTGKSFVLNRWREGLDKDEREQIRVVASTGAAALLVGGCTFHSFFGLGLGVGTKEHIVFKAANRRDVKDRLKYVSTIIIDEVSMIPGRLFEYADEICRLVRGSQQPFGGIRIIAVGDFYQLPPISDDKEKITDWCFRCTSWEDCDFRMVELKEIMRTSDVDFMSVLAKLRVGAVDGEVRDFLNARVISSITAESIEGTRLYGTREQVDRYNKYRLAKLPGEYKVYRTDYSGDKEYFQRLQNSMPITDKLVLKPDCLVMIRKNLGSGIVNGTLAHVKEFGVDEVEGVEIIKLELLGSKQIYTIQRSNFEWLNPDGAPVARANNFPISVAYACTIHKAQGASIDRVICDIERVWEAGQAYVALSRARNAYELYIENWKKESIFASDEVIDFYQLMEALG